jgi:hypothetical protein
MLAISPSAANIQGVPESTATVTYGKEIPPFFYEHPVIWQNVTGICIIIIWYFKSISLSFINFTMTLP